MSRSVSWRRTCPDEVNRRIEQAIEARLYILRETGPTGFLVKEDENEKKFKVFLGDPNSCTCSTFMKERDLCIHILWILLRKFRIGKENPLIFQKALVEREINEIIQGIHIQRRKNVQTEEIALDEKDKLAAKSIDEEDVCPICQEELLDCKEPLTYCKYGCGNNIHIKCMKVWAQHRKSDGDNMIKCPLCRTDFGSYQDIIQEFHKMSNKQRRKIETNDVHIGATCHHCKMSPVQGKCFRCVVCLDLHLCQECFGKPIHTQHSFQFRKNTNQRWRAASRNADKILPTGIVENLQNREIREEDYELLLQLDSRTNVENGASIILPLTTLNSSSQEVKERLQCQICCQSFRISNYVRRLACHHSFHKDCIDEWISRGNLLCPFDRSRIAGRKDVKSRSKTSSEKVATVSNQNIELSVLGINSSNLFTNKEEREARLSRPTRRRSTQSSSTGQTVGDVSDLIISGASSRDISREAGTPLSSVSVTKRSSTHTDRELSTSNLLTGSAGLPPVHPTRGQLRNNSSHTVKRQVSNDRLHIERSLHGNELKIGALEKASSAKVHKTRGSLVKKRLSSGAVASISTSEPDLVSLADAFRISRITNLESGSGV